MKLNIQLFGGRGASSKNNTSPKKAKFITATRTYDENGNAKREDIEVNGVSFKYKGIEFGVFNADQEAYTSKNTTYFGRGTDKYVAVVISDGEANGASLATGKTRKEAMEKVRETIDKNKSKILKAMGKKK